MTDGAEARGAPRGPLVEGVRLIFVALLGTAGYQVATQTGSRGTGRILLFVFLGSAVGFVVGGMMGRLTVRTVRGLEGELRRTPAAEMAAGTAGLIVGLVLASLLSLPLLFVPLPAVASWPVVLFLYLTFSSLGFRIARAKHEELFALFGLKPRAAGSARGEISVIDTSALIDGRVADLVETGFLSGMVLVHEGVLRELQAVADSSDPNRRSRGRRGLDVLATLQRAPAVDVVVVEEAGVSDVDAALVRLARDRGASLVTVDANLAKVAEALSVPVRRIHALASAFRPPFAPGDEVSVRLVKEGREHGQGIGYLEDGTMVVVEEARDRIGEDVSVRVRNVIQTPTGRMVFASLAEGR